MRGSNSLRGKFKFAPRLLSAAAALLAALFAPSAHAARDTAKPSRLHHASTAAPKSKSPKSSSAHSAARPPHSSSHFIVQNTSHFVALPQGRSTSYPPHSTPRSRAYELRQRAAAQPLTQSFPVRPQTAAQLASNSTSQGQISAQPRLAARKTLTTEDFMRAAGDTATVSAAPTYTPPQQQRAQSERIDGFGAEGAILNSPRRSAAPQPAAALPEPEDPELAALSHPSHEEMAEAAVQPRLPNLYSRNGHLIVPAPLVGSHDVLVHQNEMADAEGLSRIENDAQLATLRAHRLLVDIPESASLQLNPDLPDNRRCARPWTVKFATDMARAFYSRFHQPLQINSAARTVQYQMHLERVNGNAAGVDGDSASPHLTGQAVDFGKRGMSIAQIAWMRAYLKPLMDSGKLDVEEEFRQACFHISVYRSYLPTRKSPPRNEVAQLGATSGEK